MRVIVIDASVAVKWYVHESGRDEALLILENEDLSFAAPDVLLPEGVNALLRQHRHGKLAANLLERALLDLDATSPELVASATVMSRAVQLARHLRHPIYDCLYLALAERRNTVLLTADVAFAKLCRAALPDDPVVERLATLGEPIAQ